ncbi:uncharacterized protein [Blastocystis hominis]|uniref:Methyltransferase type 11 domain-containing protein n=1 Tax=Blastocystis hominis TaxID=12968 RepID=D8M554_BLAHO|nr:uncharacterized protein [Blastocystis hominis]CBK23205.2 unnamed protein product [Blastocystis hominis]|eukprot:XP_012897253.1 uncharacterized protein [Blastocystis hominis]
MSFFLIAGLVYVHCENLSAASRIYTLCSSGSALIDGKYAIHPTYVIPVSAVTSPPPEDIQYDLQQEDITPMESSPFSELFHLLRSLYHFEDENSDILLTERIEQPGSTWKACVPRYEWKEIPPSVKALLPSRYDCVLLKCFRGKEATPIHLDHNLFDSQLTALLDADPTSDIVVYNTQTHLYFREGVSISNVPRFSSFLWCRSKIQKQNRLIVLCRRTSPGFTCRCNGELCIQRILHASAEKEGIQKEFVDQVVLDSLFYSFHNAILLDTGCGDCKYICNHMQKVARARQNVILGQDNSDAMLRLHKYPEWSRCCLVRSDICNLSMASNRFDGVLSISVIQHLPSKYKQLEAIQSLVRVCKPGGRILIYVWSFEKEDRKPRFPSSSQDHFLTWELPSASSSPTQVTRYFYLFQHGELDWLCSYVPSVRPLRRFFDGKNWCIELQKLSLLF